MSSQARSPSIPSENTAGNSPNSLFSPIQVCPTRSPQAGNLTGSARKVKDSAADWHNHVQSWNALSSKGMSIINKIANLKLETIFNSTSSADDEEDSVTRNTFSMPEELETWCKALDTVLEGMNKIVKKLEIVTAALKGVRDLEWHRCVGGAEPLFQTWPIEEFYNASEELLAMFNRELELKTTIVQNVAHVQNRETLMFYTSAWLHQPYIDKNADILIQSMVVETGFR
ncbi:cyclin-dependent kinase 2-interacting protein [Lingula anatina]|uniref:Cyclin-dependent kinase 2-interacting protein n=1 Tax=Lingula anatina TaxID=7574 RepID=A0A1S3J2G4_LINAN|nr:cyclin-dependent kinase 2-interacting protein [Lingula anatina]|eukprot:XP_013404602.1 cyclin-dependent kinase 2-interacting protein [Lingula anatina]